MNKTREPGYYWVQLKSGKWIICEFTIMWHHQGCSYNDDSFYKIDERKLIRNEI